MWRPAIGLLEGAGAEPNPENIALLQTASTGMAVVALATGQVDQAPVVTLLSTLPRHQRETP